VDGITRYAIQVEGDSPHEHPHFSCRICGEVQCLPKAKLGGTVEPRWDSSIRDAELQLVGYCPDCRRKKTEDGGKRRGLRRGRVAR
jgi:Fe2+ or Zn2+ uptake regulation protein